MKLTEGRGLTDRVIEGLWKWTSTGSAPTFTSWYPGQLDNGGNEDCAHIQSGTRLWNDFACTVNFLPLCEKNMTSVVEIIG